MHGATASPYEMIRSGDLSGIEKWLAEGADPNAAIIDDEGEATYALYTAVQVSNEPIVLYLLQSGATLAVSNVTFEQLASRGLTKSIAYLLAEDRYNDQELCQAIHAAAGRGFYDVIQLILDHQSKAKWNCSFAAAISAALSFAYDDIARLLVDSGRADFTNLLHLAARFRTVGLVRVLLVRGADPNQILVEDAPLRNQMQTPLDFALWEYDPSAADDRVGIIIGDLIKAGVRVDRPIFEKLSIDSNTYLSSAGSVSDQLIEASKIGFDDVVSSIVAKHGASLSQSGLTLATIAALENNNDHIARVLLSNGVDVNDGPLQIAVFASSPGMVRSMLASGGQPESEYLGKTSTKWLLHSTKTIGNPNMAETLRELVVSEAKVCWLTEHLDSFDGFTQIFFARYAPECFESPGTSD